MEEKIIDSAKEISEILKWIEEMKKKANEIKELKEKEIVLRNPEGDYLPFSKKYEGFSVDIYEDRHLHISIHFNERSESVCIKDGQTVLGDLLIFAKYKDKILPILKEELSEKDKELDKTIDSLKRAIAALALAGFEVI